MFHQIKDILEKAGINYQSHGQRQADEDEGPRLITVGKITDGRLDDKGKEAHGTGNDTYLRQTQAEFADKDRKQRGDEGGVKIPGKMDESESKEYFQISRHPTDSWVVGRA